VIVEEPIQTFERNSKIQVSANVPITLQTRNGYFKSNNKNIKVQSRTADSVTFYIPFGISEVTVEIKEKGDIVKKTYRVV
jgi:hypothetical protein